MKRKGSLALAVALLAGPCIGASPSAAPGESSGLPVIENPNFADLGKVIVVSKKSEDILDAPGTVHVITAEDIRRYGWRDMREVLWAIPNLDMYWNWNGANGGQRGFTGNSAGTLLLIDGREAQNLVADEALMQNFPVHRIKRVEVLQGPGSALYGSNANEGVINIVTKVADPDQDDAGMAGFLAGESEMRSGYALMRRNSGDASLGVSTSFFSTLNDHPELRAFAVNDALYSRNPALDAVREHDESKAYFPIESQTFDFSASSRHLYAGANYFREQGLPGIERPRARFGERKNERWIFLGYGGAKMERGAFQGNAEYIVARERLSSLGGTAVRPTPNRVFRPDRHRVKGQGMYRFADQTVVFGYDGWIFDAELLQSANPGGLEYPFIPFQDFTTYQNSLFAEYTVHFLDGRLKVNAGLRFDKQKGLEGTAIPRAGVVYRPTANSSLKALYGRGLRVPNAWEVNNARLAGIGEGFPSRETDDIEVNYVQVVRLGDWLITNSLSAYRMESTNNFNQVLGADNFYRLSFVPDKVILGTEDFLRVTFRGRYGALAGGRLIAPDEGTVAGEKVIEDVPVGRAKLGLFAEPLDWFGAGLFIDASGEVMTDAATLDGQGVEVLRIPGWVNTNANLRFGDFRLDDRGDARIGLTLFVENLFDETYYHPNHRGLQPIQYIQPPRNWRMTAEMRF